MEREEVRRVMQTVRGRVCGDVVAGRHDDRQLIEDFTRHGQQQENIINGHWTSYVRQLYTDTHSQHSIQAAVKQEHTYQNSISEQSQ